MSTYIRQPGDRAVQVYLPTGVAYEIGKLRLLTRKTNNEILTELLTEALIARGLLIDVDQLIRVLELSGTTAPVAKAKPSNSGKSGKTSKPKAKPKAIPKAVQVAKIKGYTAAELAPQAQLSLPVAPVANDIPTEPAGLAVPAAPVSPSRFEELTAKQVDEMTEDELIEWGMAYADTPGPVIGLAESDLPVIGLAESAEPVPPVVSSEWVPEPGLFEDEDPKFIDFKLLAEDKPPPPPIDDPFMSV